MIEHLDLIEIGVTLVLMVCMIGIIIYKLWKGWP